jgi:hypothetical protein
MPLHITLHRDDGTFVLVIQLQGEARKADPRTCRPWKYLKEHGC